ncbi:hypothetical protein A2X44_03060 [candidate division CPR3 bacterium GWF2_35_18]|uniref:Uncharacterized protein n=1 Tax=candidate division CPR3 bacterium GW2011_GWF2_35_18 TaxID=1618350 RepID=A0A0G0E2N9_UNCC3|nr:MAG: hypothetical protein UR67_C0006G0052 [candidate division CPR3 bacterium GW2011_GWF2_35_18]KKR76453.1 MAG: hypothetical protein UU20_C0025G0009 [Parcubacteria group bacterium GW2011_GWE2_40_8]OGB62957.1 MAG: hypothetical protein A2X44_03060 [candidate division CPR3 bacterium GWF2_35_18]OGB65917.1 MAG: hypothetical protein A2250_03330 [candidate division CPR3 bacterium RIFOXYA2_FULL_35_13]OGB75895.1 MAG: hypothetical protein A2476_04690 [candidate division CPR3 bacterium RIFOXYC2_FULL_35_
MLKKIYVSHLRNSDYKNSLYKPLRNSFLNNKYEFIFPHENSKQPYEIKKLLESNSIDIVLAEVSFPSTGQGIELGWADIYQTPIVCIYKKGVKTAYSLQKISNEFIEYENLADITKILETTFKEICK